MSAEGTDRKRLVEQVPSESEERLRAIFAQAVVGIAQVGLDGEWLLVNNRFCQMLGYSEAELRARTLQDISHPDDFEVAMAARRKLLAGEISCHTMEKRYIRKDRSIFWGRLNRSLVRDHDNLPKYFISVLEDITDRIQAEQALRDSEQRFRLAQKAAHLAVWERDLHTNKIVTSGEYAKLYGLASDHPPLTYEGWLGLIHPEDRERVRQLALDALERTHVWDAEFRVVWPDGSVHWLLGKGAVFPDDSGHPVLITGVNLDITERKHAAAALRESEERFRFAQQAAGIGTFDWNIENGENTWTPELEAMYGLPPGGFPRTQAAWEDLVHPDDRARAVQLVTKSFESGAPTRGEWRVVWPDGSVHWLSGRWQVFKNSVGKPVRMTGVNIDVTDRQLVKQALLQSEERFRLAVQATNDAIWDIDLATGTVRWNETYTTLYGRPPETSNSWRWWIDRIHPEDRERTSDGLRSAIRGSESTWTGEYRFQRVDGTWAYLYDRAYIARDASGSAWRVIGAMQDLTERKRAEAALRESEERFRKVFEEGPLGLALVGRDYHFLKVNRALCEMVGYTEEELLQMSFADITHSDDLRTDVELAERLFRGDIPFYKLQKRYVKKSDEIIWINLTASVIRDREGKPAQGLSMVEDITEAKRRREEALARQKLENLGVLAAGIAHDFNNLLGGILAEAELIAMDLTSPSVTLEELHRIKASASRGAEIVRELMIYAGQDQANPIEPVDVSRLIAGMLELLKISISKHAGLTTSLQQDLPAVWGSPAKIRQLVMNLVLNASEAIGDKAGAINVTTEHVSGGKELVLNGAADLSEGDYVRLEVSDTGCGIPEELRTKIFDPFFSTKFVGRGLGLAVVHGIVQAHSGAINLVSTPGRGTTFQVLLSCAGKASNTQSSTTSAVSEQSNARTRTVLVVEDEEAIRHAVSKALAKSGFSVMEACDGSAAMELIRAHIHDIDAVLLDITLPGTTSREVFEEIQGTRPDLKVILTSAYGKQTVDAAFAGLRVEHFIRKPFQLSDLANVLRALDQ